MLTQSTYAEISHFAEEEMTFVFFIEESDKKIEKFIEDPEKFFPLLFEVMQIEPEKVLRMTMGLEEVQRLFSEDIEELPLMIYMHEGMLEGASSLLKLKSMIDTL